MATVIQNTGHQCPSGRHTMDPNWKNCPYCDGEKRSHQQTAHPNPELVNSTSSRKTSIGNPEQNVRRETRQMQENNPQLNFGGSGGQGDTRRIVGILITYNCKLWPQGGLFPVREGKNYIGAGYVSREPGDPQCDILVKDADPKLSSSHALILYRGNIFEIVDLESTNGTFVNDERIPIRGADLPDNSIIKTGNTLWTFMKIQPLAGATQKVENEPEVRAEEKEQPLRPQTKPR